MASLAARRFPTPGMHVGEPLAAVTPEKRVFAGFTGPAPKSTEQGLIEWIDFQSQSDAAEEEELPAPDRGSPATFNNLPLCLLDNSGTKGNRARKPEPTRSSSIVYQAIAGGEPPVTITFSPPDKPQHSRSAGCTRKLTSRPL